MRETRAYWDAIAPWFQREADVPVGVHWGPGTPADDDLGLLPDVAGADVVELGCGGGQFGTALARRGAARVVGVDLSIAQLEHARYVAGGEVTDDDAGVDRGDSGSGDDVADRAPAAVIDDDSGTIAADLDLVAGDVAHLPLAADVADLAVSAYAFQWVPDLAAVFAEAARVLRPDGVFVFGIPHPFYTVFDPETGELDRSYFDDGPQRVAVDGVDADEVLHRRRLGDVHGALRAAGFVVDEIREPGSADPAEYEEVFSSDPGLMAQVPRTLVVRAEPTPDA